MKLKWLGKCYTDNSQIENKRASISKSGAIMKGKEGKNPVWSKNYMNGSKNGSVGSCSDKEPITEEEMECWSVNKRCFNLVLSIVIIYHHV